VREIRREKSKVKKPRGEMNIYTRDLVYLYFNALSSASKKLKNKTK
jgi:hypothetical protein